MRIKKSCRETEQPKPTLQVFMTIGQGVVFRYACGEQVYLRTQDGAVDLKTGRHHAHTAFPPQIEGYKELSNAFLVTGEEA